MGSKKKVDAGENLANAIINPINPVIEVDEFHFKEAQNELKYLSNVVDDLRNVCSNHVILIMCNSFDDYIDSIKDHLKKAHNEEKAD